MKTQLHSHLMYGLPGISPSDFSSISLQSNCLLLVVNLVLFSNQGVSLYFSFVVMKYFDKAAWGERDPPLCPQLKGTVHLGGRSLKQLSQHTRSQEAESGECKQLTTLFLHFHNPRSQPGDSATHSRQIFNQDTVPASSPRWLWTLSS